MSNAKAVAAPQAAPSARPARRESEAGRVARTLNQSLRGSRKVFLLALFWLVAEAGTSIAAKYPLAYLIDYLLGAQPDLLPAQGAASGLAPRTVTLVALTLAIVAVAILNSLSDSLAEIQLARGGRLLGFNLRNTLYSHLQKLSLAFYSRQRTGDLLTRVTSDVTALEEFSIKSLKDIAGSIFLLVLSVGALLTISWQIALATVVMLPVIAVISNQFADRIKGAAKQQRAREGDLAAAAQEMLTSIRVIQTYGSAGGQQERFAEQSQKTMDVALLAARLQAWFSGVINVLQAVTIVLVVWLGVWLVDGTVLSVGTLVFCIGLIQDLFKPTKRIIKEWNAVGKIFASVERIHEVLDRKPAVQNEPGAVEAPPLKGHIEYQQVSFAYQPEGEPDGQLRLALREVSLSIAPGEVVALVGGSGAGKSTIAQLLPRLYDPHLGQILIDGHDIRGFTLESLRSRMSMVLQETILFTGTVAENIAYGRARATREQVIAAAIQANAHDFIEALPQGYDTPLSERAANLSGGQRQRLAIARAFIRNTPILILDEPTTGLDAESSDLVLLALRSLMKDKSTLIISHDLNLIRHASRILVVKQGVIDQIGTHRELLKAGGLYAELYHKQFGQAMGEQAARPAGEADAQRLPAAPAVVQDDEDAAPAPRREFQTMISHALPAPVSRQEFATVMLRAVAPPEAPAEAGAAPAPASPAPRPAPATTLLRVTPEDLAGARARGVADERSKAPPAPPRPAPATTLLRVTPEDLAERAVADERSKAPPAAPVADEQPAPAPAAPRPAPATTFLRLAPEDAGPLADEQPAPAPAAPASVADEQPAPALAAPRPAPATTFLRVTPEDLAGARAGATADEQPVAPPVASMADEQLAASQLDPAESPALREALPGLAAALDMATMRDYLQAALLGRGGQAATLAECALGSAAVLPNGDCVLHYKLAVQATDGRRSKLLARGRIMASQLDCALHMRDRLGPLMELHRDHPGLRMLRTPAALIEPLDMVVSVFPLDGDLPTLAGATDPARMAEVIGEAIGAGEEEPLEVTGCRVEVVDYARQGRCTLRYTVDGRRPGSEEALAQTVYGKVYGDDMGAAAALTWTALHQHTLATGGFAVPRTLVWRPDLKLALLETLPGEPIIADVLSARLRGEPAPAGAPALEELVERSALVAAGLHGSGIRLGPRRSFGNELAALQRELALVQRFSPALAARLEAALIQLERYAEQSDPLPLRLAHGDFTHGQLLTDGPAIGLVDLDNLCQAEPALDLAQFLVYLRIAARKSDPATAAPLLEQLGERFLAAYGAAGGEALDDPQRLRVRIAIYRVVSLLRRVMRSWQKLKGSRAGHALALLEEELACLQQLDY